MFAARIARVVVGRRQMSGRIQKIREKYPAYSNPAVGADNPTYLKESGDKVFLAVGIGGAVVGVVCVLNGLWNMSFGINKV